jgi:hypothetical protein
MVLKLKIAEAVGNINSHLNEVFLDISHTLVERTK